MGPLDKFMLSDHSLLVTDSGCDLIIRSHWYRSLPLSCIGNIGLKINEKNIPSENISFEVNGKIFSFNELGNLYQEWWFILDSAILHIENNFLEEGKEYKVELELGLLIPYVLVGPDGQPMLSSSKLSKNLLSRRKKN
ncbi:MAG: hypothetical protein JST75_01610 [Bacteroidetes bacterium]|nr:hypothetical protein [Bacteroidota bacterium]